MEKLFDGGHFFEGPRWHDGHWYSSDLYGPKVYKISPEGKGEAICEVPNQPSGLGWLPDGTMLVVSMKDAQVMKVAGDGSISVHGDCRPGTVSFANDMVVDKLGRAYVGTFGFNLFEGEQPERGAISRVDPDGTVSVVATGMDFPNGMAVSEDNNTLVVAETFGSRLTTFSINADGSLQDKKTLGQLGKAPAWDSLETLIQLECAPDGLALDAEGCVWVADAWMARALRVSPSGDVLDEVKAPEGMGLFSLTLGGPNGNTLMICCAPSFADHERKPVKESELWIQDVAVPRGDARP
ncbi:SMP-30/gluconolactonase/LRE family protein [Sporichthya sp.]|uniref:SMP-30/gluconolactonase/LRE family protein n=1 Tax=Sporichthya sp. TaxID=65475 RepID=UPI001826A9AB|nr:SMP-30/gluconolactonase/LRE family protein [Sporichthya sp.]MBA3743699.1 SMP-30/gluconolactonase/LRE family protein [Sporichthya sp.]